jgi:hypothetical protein
MASGLGYWRKALKFNRYSIRRNGATPGKPCLAALVCASAGQVTGGLAGFDVENLTEEFVKE